MAKYKKLPTRKELAAILRHSFIVNLLSEGHMDCKDIFQLMNNQNLLKFTKKEQKSALEKWNKLIGKEFTFKLLIPER